MATIMVVDDDPDFVEIVTLILESQYEVTSAANGKQALERMREQEKPDLVLLDVMMSYVLDGVDVAETMSLDPELKGIPVIMVSSLPTSQSSAYSERFPTDHHVAVNDWMSKPVDPDDLLARIAKFLT
jgi:CheY-like chemotaxis protein